MKTVVVANLSANQRADLIGHHVHGGPLPVDLSFSQRAAELARRFGIAMTAQLLAAEAQTAPAGLDDPQTTIRARNASCWLPDTEIASSLDEAVFLPGGSEYYLFRMRDLPPDAPKLPSIGKGWLRESMPQLAITFDWLRTWVPANVIRKIFANLYAGEGYAIDTSTSLAIGNVPRQGWIVTVQYENGLKKVKSR